MKMQAAKVKREKVKKGWKASKLVRIEQNEVEKKAEPHNKPGGTHVYVCIVQ